MNDPQSLPSEGFVRTILRYVAVGLVFVPAGVGYALFYPTGRGGWILALCFLALGFCGALLVEGCFPQRPLARSRLALTSLSDRKWGLFVKRALDVAVAVVGLILELPLFILISIAVAATSRGPLFQRDERIGRHGRQFALLRFRTYRLPEWVGSAVWARDNSPRVTAVGRLLRGTRLDELPQLLNVLRGDMSFIGPRPERAEMVREIIPEGFRGKRESVRPGITGWAQVNAGVVRDFRDYVRALEYDMFYIENWSLRLDWIVVARSIQVGLFSQREPVEGRVAFGILLTGPIAAAASVVAIVLRHVLR